LLKRPGGVVRQVSVKRVHAGGISRDGRTGTVRVRGCMPLVFSHLGVLLCKHALAMRLLLCSAAQVCFNNSTACMLQTRH
jgi:hypothetical protein